MAKIAAALRVNPSFLVDLPIGDDVSATHVDDRLRLVGARNGATWEILTAERPDAELSLFMLELSPDMKHPLEQLPRAGDKFLHVVEGVLQIDLDEETTVLRKGDCIHFRASRSMKLQNLGDSACRVFWAAWPRLTF